MFNAFMASAPAIKWILWQSSPSSVVLKRYLFTLPLLQMYYCTIEMLHFVAVLLWAEAAHRPTLSSSILILPHVICCISELHASLHITHKHTTKQVLRLYLFYFCKTTKMGTLFEAPHVLQKYFLVAPLLVFQFPAAKLSVIFTLAPYFFFPHLIPAGLICVFRFHLPTNHSHTSPSRQGDTLRCTTSYSVLIWARQ